MKIESLNCYLPFEEKSKVLIVENKLSEPLTFFDYLDFINNFNKIYPIYNQQDLLKYFNSNQKLIDNYSEGLISFLNHLGFKLKDISSDGYTENNGIKLSLVSMGTGCKVLIGLYILLLKEKNHPIISLYGLESSLHRLTYFALIGLLYHSSKKLKQNILIFTSINHKDISDFILKKYSINIPNSILIENNEDGIWVNWINCIN